MSITFLKSFLPFSHFLIKKISFPSSVSHKWSVEFIYSQIPYRSGCIRISVMSLQILHSPALISKFLDCDFQFLFHSFYCSLNFFWNTDCSFQWFCRRPFLAHFHFLWRYNARSSRFVRVRFDRDHFQFLTESDFSCTSRRVGWARVILLAPCLWLSFLSFS